MKCISAKSQTLGRREQTLSDMCICAHARTRVRARVCLCGGVLEGRGSLFQYCQTFIILVILIYIYTVLPRHSDQIDDAHIDDCRVYTVPSS